MKFAAWTLFTIIAMLFVFSQTQGMQNDPKDAKRTNLEDNNRKAPLKIELCPVYGEHGTQRSSPLIAGETICVRGIISGLTTDKNGNFKFSMQSKLFGIDGRCEQSDTKDFSGNPPPLGVSIIPAKYGFEIAKNAPPGKYRICIKVTDDLAETQTEEAIEVEILPASTLGLLNLRITKDGEGKYSLGSNLTVGEPFYIIGTTNGLSDLNDRVKFRMSLALKDVNHKILADRFVNKEYAHAISECPSKAGHIPVSMSLTRPGKYIISVQLTDVIVDQSVLYDLPVNVLMPPDLEPEDRASSQDRKSPEKSGI